MAVVLVILGYQYFGGRRGVEVAEQAQQSAEQTAEKTEQAAEAVEKAGEQAAEATQEAGEQAAEATQEAAEATQEAEQAKDTAEQAAAGSQQAAETTQEAAQEAQQATEQAAEATQGAAQQATEQAQGAAQQAAAGDRAGGRGHARGGQATQEAAEGALTEAQTAALTVGNVNVGEQVTGIMTSLDGTLKGVTDAPSAQAAVTTLNDINTKLDQLSGTVSQLPGDAKKVLADVLSKHVAGLKTLAAEVTAKEGVGPVIKPALDPVIAKLEDWARQPA